MNEGRFAFDFEHQLEEEERARVRDFEVRAAQYRSAPPIDGDGANRANASRVRRGSGFLGAPADEAPVQKRLKATHHVVCRHWLRGMCIKGDYCDFLHIFDPARMPPCRQFRKHGRCADAEQGICPLRHDKDLDEGRKIGDDETGAIRPLGGEEGDTTTTSLYHRPKSNMVCLQYLFGYCTSGPHCTLRHVALRPEERPDIPLPDWYLHLVVENRVGGGDICPLDVDTRKESARQWQELSEQVASEEDKQTGAVSKKTLEDLMPNTGLPPKSTAIRAFVIKSAKIENILTSIQKGIWATGKANIEKFEQAFRTCDHVIFLMSANESGGFQGFARMHTLQDPTLYPRVWGTFSSKLSSNFRVQWLKQCKVDFEALASFTNPWNENKPLRKSRDGQVS